MTTVRINTYDPRVSAGGAPLPEANLLGSFQMDMQSARTLGHLSDSLRGLAGIELRMKDAARNDLLNSAKVNYLNDIMREADRMGNEDQDYGTQRERYVQFQNERRQYYEDSLNDDDLRQAFKNEILIPTARHEFEVGQAAMTGLNDRILANFNERVNAMTSQAGWSAQRDSDIEQMILQDLGGMVDRKVISAATAQKSFAEIRNDIQLKQLGVMQQTDPTAILSAGAVFGAPAESLSKSDIVGGGGGNRAEIKSHIFDKAVAAGNDPRMMLGLAEAESGFNPNAKSVVDNEGRYAAGIFQFRGPAAKDMGLIDERGDRRFDAEANIDAAMRYIKTIESLVPGGRDRPDLMIASWLMGPNDKDIQAGRVPADAVEYVSKVLEYGYGKDGGKGLPQESLDGYRSLLSRGYTTQQILSTVPAAKEAYSKQVQGKAYDLLSQMPINEALRDLSDPQVQQWLGLSTSDAQAVEGALYTHFNHMKTVKTQEREDYETGVVTQATDTALGAGGAAPNPVAARQIIIDSSLDGYSKSKALKAIELDEVGKNDDTRYVSDLQSRIVASRGIMPDSEILQGVLDGRMTLETKDKMLKLKEQAKGPWAGSIDSAYKYIDEAFRGSIFMEGNPAVARAKFEAKQELDFAMQDALSKGTVAEVLDPSSPKYILPGIVSRHYLNSQEQAKAGLDMMRQNRESIQQGSTASTPAPKPAPQGGVPRINAQTIEDYDAQWAERRASADYADVEPKL